MKKAAISASMMCTDLTTLDKVIEIFEQEKIDYLHIDIMDGEFVPNFGLGVDYIRGLRGLTNIPLDLHLMVMKPEYKFNWLGIKENDIISIHYESTFQIQRAIDYLKPYGCKILLAINPGTPIFCLDEILDFIDGVNVLMVNPGFAGQQMIPNAIKKVEKLVGYLKKKNKKDFIIEVDGNITFSNAKKLKQLGANMFVCGSSSIFQGNVKEYRNNIKKIKEAIES